MNRYSLTAAVVDYFPSENSTTLFICFEGRGGSYAKSERDRSVWGASFLRKNGFSVLGIKPDDRRGWYRDITIRNFFLSDVFFSISSRYEKVIWYGNSMGGHAAINFSWTVPNSIVIALQPQVTLDRSIVPWERRYPESINLDWSSPFGSLDGYNRAKNVYIFYDPLHELDNRQVSLLKGDSLIRCKCFS